MSVKIENLRLSYGEHAAVRDLSLTVDEGDFVVLLGPSGCGKTSTMRCIVGLEQPDAGRITIKDRVVFDDAQHIDVPTNKRNVGMVFQSYAVWPHKSVFQNVSYPLQVKRTSRRIVQEQVEEALELVGLQDQAQKNASMLSGGQMQRVALARSLVMRPDVLLLDEPLSNLDAKLREHLRYELKQIQARLGVTTVYVTHDQQEALALADKVVVMNGGVIEQEAAPEELYARPQSKFVADFLGSANIFSCEPTATSENGTTELSLGPSPVRLKTSGVLPQGGDLYAVVRPEEVRFADAVDVADHDCLVEVRIKFVSFLGHQTRYRLEVVDAADIRLDIITDSSGVFKPVGSRTHVAIRPQSVQVLNA